MNQDCVITASHDFMIELIIGGYFNVRMKRLRLGCTNVAEEFVILTGKLRISILHDLEGLF